MQELTWQLQKRKPLSAILSRQTCEDHRSRLANPQYPPNPLERNYTISKISLGLFPRRKEMERGARGSVDIPTPTTCLSLRKPTPPPPPDRAGDNHHHAPKTPSSAREINKHTLMEPSSDQRFLRFNDDKQKCPKSLISVVIQNGGVYLRTDLRLVQIERTGDRQASLVYIFPIRLTGRQSALGFAIGPSCWLGIPPIWLPAQSSSWVLA